MVRHSEVFYPSAWLQHVSSFLGHRDTKSAGSVGSLWRYLLAKIKMQEMKEVGLHMGQTIGWDSGTSEF